MGIIDSVIVAINTALGPILHLGSSTSSTIALGLGLF